MSSVFANDHWSGRKSARIDCRHRVTHLSQKRNEGSAIGTANCVDPKLVLHKFDDYSTDTPSALRKW